MLARQALCNSYVSNPACAISHVTKILSRRRHQLTPRTVKHRVALATARQYAGHENKMASPSPFDNMAVRRYTTYEHDYQPSPSPFDNMGVRRYATKSASHEMNDVVHSQSPFDNMGVRRFTTVTKREDLVASPSPFDNMAIPRTTTKSTQKHFLLRQENSSLLSPSPFDNMGVRRFSTLSPQPPHLSSSSPFENLGVRIYTTKSTRGSDFISYPSPFDTIGVRRFSTVLTEDLSYDPTPSPFDMMGVRRYSTVYVQDRDNVSSPSPFDMMAVRRYSTQERNVVASPFADVAVPQLPITEYVWERVDEWAEKTAIVCGISGHSYTYSQLRATCQRFASGLRRRGFMPGQVLAVILPNTPDYAVVMLGSVEAGLMVTTVNPVYVPNEIAKQLVDSNPHVIVAFPEKYKEIVEAVRIAGEKGYADPLIVITPSPESSEVPAGAVAIQHLLDNDDVSNLSPVTPVDCTAPVMIPYSSGTTGLPKGVCLSHRNLVANIQQLQGTPRLSITRPTTSTFQEVVPAVLPFYHIYGMNGILFSKLAVGVMVVTLPKFQTDTFLDTIQKYKATILFLVPPLVLFMGLSPLVTPEHLNNVTYVLSGAAPIGEQDVARFLKKAPPTVQFLQGYGLTETSPCVFTTVPNKPLKKLGSVGQLVPNTWAKIISTDTGKALGPGEVGEVCCYGPQNMLGYYNNPKATADMIDSEGWLHTGDLGYYDDDRDFYIVDRLKELIKVKGFQVAPAELEELLRSHPDVLDAAVIGIPDSRTGEAPLGFIVPRPGAGSGIEEAVMSFVASKVSSYKQLVAVKCLTSIPKSPAGKILRKILREDYKTMDIKRTPKSTC